MAATSSREAAGQDSTSGDAGVRPKTRVRASAPLSWPRVGVEVPISLAGIGQTGCVYGEPRRTTCDYLRARYYDPATAQFLSRDPLVAQTKAPYGYVGDNPLNATDPTGLCSWNPFDSDSCEIAAPARAVSGAAGWTANHVVKPVAQATLDVVATPFYAAYYGSYYAASGVNWVGSKFGLPGSVISHIIAAPLAIPEAIGLGGDVGIDWVKGHTVNSESVCDEGQNGYINPLHSFLPGPLKGPQIYLPGVHSNGRVDFEW